MTDIQNAFREWIGRDADEAFLQHAQDALRAGMGRTAILDALRQAAPVARTLGTVYANSYGEAAGREKAGMIVYQEMRRMWRKVSMR